MRRLLYVIALRLLKYPINVIYFICCHIKKRKNIIILSSSVTIDKIVENSLSVSRFGDGELKLIRGESIGFQEANPELGERLLKVLQSKSCKHLVCVLNVIAGDFSLYTSLSTTFWKKNMIKNKRFWEDKLVSDYEYGDSLFTRFYVEIKDKEHCKEMVLSLKRIWDNRDLLVVEGVGSRLGVGNDLFDNCISIKRILCPSKNSFSVYNTILNKVSENADDRLILIALGPTATVLAYDLSQLGYQAIDVGHIDIEYEWYLQKASDIKPIAGKNVNECNTEGGEIIDITYESQIICSI